MFDAMNDTTDSTDGQDEYISLLDSIERGEEWLKLPHDTMRECGPAAQTLGGILRLTNREMFVPLEDIASAARLQKRTVQRHLVKLDGRGWIHRKGRQKTRSGWLRRTATIQLTAKARAAAATTYGVLPWWACCEIRRHGRFNWATKAVLSIVLGRLMSLKAAIEEQVGHGLDDCDVWGSIANMGDEERFRFSLDSLQRQTGLSRQAAIDAKPQLKKRKIVNWTGAKEGSGSHEADILYPNEDFLVRVIPASQGCVFLECKG